MLCPLNKENKNLKFLLSCQKKTLTVQSTMDSRLYSSHQWFASWSMHPFVLSRVELKLPSFWGNNRARWSLLHRQRAQSATQQWLPRQYQTLLVDSSCVLGWHSQLQTPIWCRWRKKKRKSRVDKKVFKQEDIQEIEIYFFNNSEEIKVTITS